MRRRGRGPRGWGWWLPQVALLLALAGLVLVIARTVSDNMERQDMVLSLGFLRSTAEFPIAESFLAYAPGDTIAWAFVVGLGNSIALTLLIIVLSTMAGVPIALARHSGHMLARTLAGGFVDLVRNVPLVVQLLFWYGVILMAFPPARAAAQPLPGLFLTNRGITVTTVGITGTALPMIVTVLGGLTLTLITAWRGHLHKASLCTLGTIVAGSALWIVLDLGLARDVPHFDRFNFTGGLTLTPEFVAVLWGSVIYASAFAAEIVRGGLDGVPRGQWEASRALGLSKRQSLRLVIVPQALRMIVPPMNSQFITILKNSTLALVVGYPDLNFVANTAINHTGQGLEGVAILMLVFFTLASAISLAMNRLNARVQRGGA
jgi:general L-amino acid transport system permease protein